MVRNCSIAIILWIGLAIGYGYVLRGQEGSGRYIGAAAMATVVWIGLALVHGVRYSIADWNAKKRLARGERPRDGELAAAVGPVHPAMEALQAPFSGQDCVLYSYDIGPYGSGEGKPARDYAGFGMTRCAVRTKYGEVNLGSFPVLEQIFETEGDKEAAAKYVANTTFEELNGPALVKAMFSVHSTAPPLKKDWQLGTPSADIEDSQIVEQLIAPGDTVTVFGRYDAASNSIVSDTKAKGYLRLRRGGDGLRVPAVPWNAIGGFFGGIAIVAAANFAFWLILQNATAG